RVDLRNAAAQSSSGGSRAAVARDEKRARRAMRRTLAFVVFVLTVALSQSCSSRTNQGVGAQSSPLEGACGGYSLTAYNGTTTESISSTRLLMPSSATIGIGGVIPSAGTSVMVTATLGTATCSGQRTLNTYPKRLHHASLADVV